MQHHDVAGPAQHVCPHVLVADVSTPELSDDDRHHLERVLRTRAGDPLTVTDGNGSWRLCSMGDELVAEGPVEVEEPRAPELTVGFCLVKGGRPELVVQKLTELGVDQLVVLTSERTVVKWDGQRADKQLTRLRRVAREALMQSKGCWLPTVDGVLTVAAFAQAHPSAARTDFGGTPLWPMAERTGAGWPENTPNVVAVGPEGGWSDQEREVLPLSVGLGDTVLRAETAALATGVILTTFRRFSP